MSPNSCLINYNKYLPTIGMAIVCVCTHAYICMQILHGYFLLYSLPGTTVFFLLMLSCFLMWEQIMWMIHLKTHVTVSSFLSCFPLWVYIWLWNNCSLLWVFLSKLTNTSCLWRGLQWPRSVCAQGTVCWTNEFEARFSTAVHHFCWLDFGYWRPHCYHLSSYFLFYLSLV